MRLRVLLILVFIVLAGFVIVGLTMTRPGARQAIELFNPRDKKTDQQVAMVLHDLDHIKRIEIIDALEHPVLANIDVSSGDPRFNDAVAELKGMVKKSWNGEESLNGIIINLYLDDGKSYYAAEYFLSSTNHPGFVIYAKAEVKDKPEPGTKHRNLNLQCLTSKRFRELVSEMIKIN